MAVSRGPIVVSTAAAAADRRTFADIIDELARPYDADDSTIRALAADAYRAAVRKYNAMGCWEWEILSVEITSSSGTASYTLPQAYKKPLSLHELDGTGGRRERKLDYIPYESLVEYHDLNDNGTPSCYALKNVFETGQLTLFPRPTSTAYYQLDYYRETPRPRTPTESIEMPEYALEAVMSEAWYEFMKRMPAERRNYDLAVAQAEAARARARITTFVCTDFDTARVR